jgi:hypothetical protein
MITLQEVKKAYKDVFLIEDDTIIEVILAICVATRMKTDPIWLMIVGAPSSGKTELVSIVGKVPFIHEISTMTENTFLSGMKSYGGKDNSLLHKIGPNGLIVLKDYTTILSMRREKKDIIISQLREIYDGRLTKMTGNGNDQEWSGKINVLAATTDAVYLDDNGNATMGRRMIGYNMPTFSREMRKQITRRALENNDDIAEKREGLQNIVAEYINHLFEILPDKLPEIDDELSNQLIDLAEFMTHARTAVARDFKGEVKMGMEKEMPMRSFSQLYTLIKMLQWLNGGVLEERHTRIIIKIAIDSIPKDRLTVLPKLVEYNGCTAKGIGLATGYPTKRILEILEDLAINQLVFRTRDTVLGVDLWYLNKEYREIIINHYNITPKNETLRSNEGDEDTFSYGERDDDPGVIKEQEKNAQEIWDMLA